MKKLLLIPAFVLAATLTAGNASADQVTGLTTFTSGSPAYADSVNANFSEIQDSVNDNDSRISTITDTVDDVQDSLDAVDSRISDIEDAYMGTLYLTLGPPAFVPFGDYNTYLSDLVIWLGSGTSTWHYFYTDVQLPQGAQVNSLSAWVNDITADAYISVTLARTGLNGTGLSTLASVTTTSGGVSGTQNLTDTSISYSVIDNSSYAYLVRVTFERGDRGNILQFFSAQIQYSLPAP